MAHLAIDGSLPRELAGFRNLHRGETIVVCGCGPSLNELQRPQDHITIGVNDVGRLFDPTYLVVLNPRSQFKEDRFAYVESSRARAIFTQLELRLKHPHVVRFRLGRRGGTGLGEAGTLDYTSNSPYVALMLALHMGAARIWLIGIDFTEHHFFGRTGRHSLERRLPEIDREYRRVAESVKGRGVEIVNLSRRSRLTAFPKRDLPGAPATSIPSEVPDMQLMVERSRGPLVGGFLDAFAKGAARAGLRVERAARGVVTYVDGTRVAIVWNGRHIRGGGPVVYCEHGWLPRWAYQVSPRGINADSHLAPFAWDGKALGTSDQEELERRLAALRRGSPFDAEYMRPDPPPLADLPSEFLLAPLQIENDTNILRHVPAGLRRMQAFVDEIARANPPLPILFKQHPADVRHGLRHVRLRMRRRQDSLRAHDEGNIHQLLKSGRCRGVVSLNSNVVHDALLWGVPSLVLGRNVWPQTNGPFLTSIPRDWSALFDLWQSPRVSACRDAYAWYLIRNQWTREDAENPDRVARLLRGMTGMRRPVRRPRPTVVAISRRARRINIVAANRGWLFEDLKRHFIAARVPGIHVLVGERPRADADAWIFLRAREASASPDPTRSVVQIHDMADAAAYRPGGDRAGVARCAGLVLTHPDQREVLAAAGVPLPSRHVLVRPLGALRCFSLRADMPDRFTIGWVGRPSMSEDDVKRPEWVAEVMEQIGQPARALRVVLLGERLDGIAGRLADAGVDIRYFPRHRNPIGSYPRRYHEMDCLLVTDRVAAGPNALFEALACGVPVVSTRAGWAPELIRDGENGYLADARGSLAESVMRIAAARDAWFVRRDSIRKTVERWSLEGWLRENLELAARLTADAVV